MSTKTSFDRVQLPNAVPFKCERCQREKVSKNYYVWTVHPGETKIICNACCGALKDAGEP